jgi:hypothetical protein
MTNIIQLFVPKHLPLTIIRANHAKVCIWHIPNVFILLLSFSQPFHCYFQQAKNNIITYIWRWNFIFTSKYFRSLLLLLKWDVHLKKWKALSRRGEKGKKDVIWMTKKIIYGVKEMKICWRKKRFNNKNIVNHKFIQYYTHHIQQRRKNTFIVRFNDESSIWFKMRWNSILIIISSFSRNVSFL